ncbi:hypothetical protein DPMN_082242 [Dreissena polymorpha]|uniref:Uncharacterized protein n=1 Tax=Dreissena polymorpha TaxID=45954 RepID=A0A9D3Y8W5_DREPO|nr:hypothetical protein DPMN_082242 [Dreissena polymorpha]
MANTKGPSGGMRTQSSASGSSPRLRKGSKNKGSRVSINSEVSESEISVFESDDDAGAVSERTELYTPQQAWAAFEIALKSIDNSHSECYVKKPKPTFLCSEAFQRVMLDMYGETDYGTKAYTVLKQKVNTMSRATSVATRVLSNAAEQGRIERERGDTTKVNEVRNVVSQSKPTSALISSAKRGWKMLKRRINEDAMEIHTQTQKLNWVMLQHTVKQMSNVEKTRKDLYERYGIVPTTLPDGTVVCENRMLSDRARAKLYARTKDGHHYRRPTSYQPPSLQLLSMTKTGNTNSGLTRKTASKTNVIFRKHRPLTAK